MCLVHNCLEQFASLVSLLKYMCEINLFVIERGEKIFQAKSLTNLRMNHVKSRKVFALVSNGRQILPVTSANRSRSVVEPNRIRNPPRSPPFSPRSSETDATCRWIFIVITSVCPTVRACMLDRPCTARDINGCRS